MVKPNTDRSQVGEIYTPSRCRMGIMHVGHYDTKGSKRIHQARRCQVEVRVANQRERHLKQSTQVFSRC